MNKNKEDEIKGRKGQAKQNKPTKVNKQKEAEGRTKADDFADKFPNFSALNEEERSAFFRALTEARRNVERRGVPTRERFGTVHDEYLKFYDKDEQEERQVQLAVVTPPEKSDSSLHGDSISSTSPPDQSPFPESEKEISCQKYLSSTLLLDHTSEVYRQESLAEGCESVIREESDKMVDLYLKKAKKLEEEPPKTVTGVAPPKTRAMPRFDALSPEEKEIFFRTLQVAHDSVVEKNPGRETGVRTMNAILERYQGDREATSIFRTCDETDVNLKVRVTLTSGDNERLKRTKSQNLGELGGPGEPQRWKSEDFEPEIIKEKSVSKQEVKTDVKDSNEENLCEPESSETVKDFEGPLHKTATKPQLNKSKSTKSIDSQLKPKDQPAEEKPHSKKKKPPESTSPKAASHDSLKSSKKAPSNTGSKTSSKTISPAKDTKTKAGNPKKQKKPKKEKKPKEKKVEEEISFIQAAFDNDSFDASRCGRQEKDERTREIEKMCHIESDQSVCEECERKCKKCDVQVSSVVMQSVESVKNPKPQSAPERSLNRKGSSPSAEWKESFHEKDKKVDREETKPKKKRSLESVKSKVSDDKDAKPKTPKKKESLEDKNTRPGTPERKESLGNKDSKSLKRNDSLKDKESPIKRKSSKTDSLKKNESSESSRKLKTSRPAVLETADEKWRKDLDDIASGKKKTTKLQEIVGRKDSLELRKKTLLREMARKNSDSDKSNDTVESLKVKQKSHSFTSHTDGYSEKKDAKPEKRSKSKKSSKDPVESSESDESSPRKGSSVVIKTPQSSEEECECDSTCSASERKRSEKSSCSSSSSASCTCPISCELPREISVHHLNTVSTSAVKSLVFESWTEAGAKVQADLPQEDKQDKQDNSVPEFTSGKVMFVDDNVVERIRKLIYYLDAKVQKDDYFEKEYMRLLVDYTEYLSRVLESLVSKKRRYQTQNEFITAEAHLQFGEKADPKNKLNQKKKLDLPGEKIPRSVSEQNLRLPMTIISKKSKPDKTKDQVGKEDIPSPVLSDSASSSDSENMTRFIPLYSGEKSKILTTKVRILQDLLQERAKFVEGSVSDFKIIYHPEQDYVPAEKPLSAQVLADDEEEFMQQNTNKFFKKLMRCCSCGRKKSEDRGIFENLKGEAVRVDVHDDYNKRDAVSATLNQSTMEVLKASERKKMIEKYYKKD